MKQLIEFLAMSNPLCVIEVVGKTASDIGGFLNASYRLNSWTFKNGSVVKISSYSNIEQTRGTSRDFLVVHKSNFSTYIMDELKQRTRKAVILYK